MKKCLNCNQDNIINKVIKKRFLFKQENIEIDVSIKECINCGYKYITESNKEIIKKIYLKYAKKHNLLIGLKLKQIRTSILKCNVNELDKLIQAPPGTTKAIEENMWLLTNEQNEIIKKKVKTLL